MAKRFRDPNYFSFDQPTRKPVFRSTMSREQRLALARAKQNRLVYAGLRSPSLPYAGQLTRAAPQEKNYVDLAAATYECSTTGSITLLATIAQGASVNQRIGKKCYLRSLQCRGNSFNGTTSVTSDNAILIVYDKRPTGSLPAITDILNTIDSTSMNNDNNASRFKIMKREDWILIGNISSGANMNSATAKSHDWYLPLRGLPVTFNAAGTGAIGDIDEGALYLVTVGSNATGTLATSFVAGFRTRFTEK